MEADMADDLGFDSSWDDFLFEKKPSKGSSPPSPASASKIDLLGTPSPTTSVLVDHQQAPYNPFDSLTTDSKLTYQSSSKSMEICTTSSIQAEVPLTTAESPSRKKSILDDLADLLLDDKKTTDLKEVDQQENSAIQMTQSTQRSKRQLDLFSSALQEQSIRDNEHPSVLLPQVHEAASGHVKITDSQAKRVKSLTSLPPINTASHTPTNPASSTDEDEWKQFVQNETLIQSMKQSIEQESLSPTTPNSSSRRMKRKSFDEPEKDTTQSVSLKESKRQDLWQSLRKGSITLAPTKRVELPSPMKHVQKDAESVDPPPMPTTILLETLDQKLANFEQYLGVNNALKEKLAAANVEVAAYVSQVAKLESLVAEHEQTIDKLQQQATENQSAQGVHTDVLVLRNQCFRWQEYASRQKLRQNEKELARVVWREWCIVVERRKAFCEKGVIALTLAVQKCQEKRHLLRYGFNQLQYKSALQVGEYDAKQARRMVVEYRRHSRETALHCAILLATRSKEAHELACRRRVFQHWKIQDQELMRLHESREAGALRVHTWLVHFSNTKKRQALQQWRYHHSASSWHSILDEATAQKSEFSEAKECVFELTRATAQLKERNAQLIAQVNAETEQTKHCKAELQVTKHGYVAVIMRRLELEDSRLWFRAWHEALLVKKATRSSHEHVETLSAQLNERDRFTKSLDAYNKVLQSDLERVQYVTQDTRLAVDVLTKKLLREETQHTALKTEHAALQKEMQALCTLQWKEDRMPCPLQLLQASKELLIDRLSQIFGIHADEIATSADGSYLMSWDNCYELVQSTLCKHQHPSNQSPNNNLADDMEMLSQLDSFFPPPPITLRVFVGGLSTFLSHMHDQTTDEGTRTRLNGFWRALIDSTADEDATASSSVWSRKNKLSDEIIQNQEKLLAVLEHETAVVERAVMDKASLKHTYTSSDPLKVLNEPLVVYGEWLELPQVRDLVLAYQVPLLQLFVKYASPQILPPNDTQSSFEKQLDVAVHSLVPTDVAMSLQSVLKLFEDLKLFPVVFPPDTIARFFTDITKPVDSQPSPPPPLLNCSGFIKLFGSCILSTYAGRVTKMSVREQLHTFFYELHWTATATRHPKPCYVGQEIEAILWPLFEYYSSSGDRDEIDRLSMTATKFCRFMSEIAGLDKDSGRADAELMFRKAVRVSRGSTLASRMVFDEFYMGIYYMHQMQDTTKRYDTPGDALREWMQQL